MKLVCGEEEILYPQRRVAQATRSMNPKTTVDVAEILEQKYNLLETFFNVYYDQILSVLAEDFEEELEFVFEGEAYSADYSAGEQAIAELFRNFIESGIAERVGIPGVPTKASRRRSRPSFWDTGLFKNNARFWVED